MDEKILAVFFEKRLMKMYIINVNKTMKLEVTRLWSKDFNKTLKEIKSNSFVASIIIMKHNAVAEKSLTICDLFLRKLFVISSRNILHKSNDFLNEECVTFF